MKRHYTVTGTIELCSPQCEIKDYAIGSTKCKSCECYAGKGKDKQGEFIECKNEELWEQDYK
jgi:hypothetical protein